MKKIGVLTFYYNVKNYGALLQAYALVRTINNQGYRCEQICIEKTVINKRRKRHFKIKNIPQYITVIFQMLKRKWFVYKYTKRNVAMQKFEKSIPHSEIVYNSNNLNVSLKDYSSYITGSDQVWNMNWYRKEYFLDFVPEDIYKFSYAASMPNVNINDEQKEIVKKHLKSFNAISVREKETADFLKKLTGKDVVQTLDPTLLLDKSQWDDICADRIIEGDYIFCYFLGESKEMRKEAKRFAKKVGYKIVNLPHLVKLCSADMFFANINLYDISPEQFISLIKYAKYVITDSFHATVFSTLYKTDFFVFDRTDIGVMNSRVTTLLSLTENEERFCYGDKMNVDYMLEIINNPVNETTEQFLNMKNSSIEYLKHNLSKSGVKVDEN